MRPVLLNQFDDGIIRLSVIGQPSESLTRLDVAHFLHVILLEIVFPRLLPQNDFVNLQQVR